MVSAKALASTAVSADFLHPEDLASREAAPAGDRPTVVPEACSALMGSDSAWAASDLAAADLA